MGSRSINGIDRFRLFSAPKRPSAKRGRRNHTKSRLGCGACKTSRVKCDEVRPHCGRCVWRQKFCTYEVTPCAIKIPSENLERHVWSCWNPTLGHTLDFDYTYDPSATDLGMGMAMTPVSHIMQSFSDCVDSSFHSPLGRALVKDFILPGCASHPMLMHILLAFSARRLHFLQPLSREHEIAYIFHFQSSTELFNNLLTEAVVDAQNIALVYATCLLTTMVSYTTGSGSISNSWIFQEDEASIKESLIWFMIQEGMGLISEILHCHINQTFWRLKRYPAGDQSPALSSGLDSGSSISRQLSAIYGTASGTTPDHDPYSLPLSMVNSFLRQSKVGPCQLDALLGFGPKVPPTYRRLVREKDDKALLIFMIWLSLLAQKAPWWAATRVRDELCAVTWFLSQSQDDRIRCIASNPDEVMG